MTYADPKTRIHNCKSLDELCAVLNEMDEENRDAESAGEDIPHGGLDFLHTDLPTFGGDEPDSTSEIFSWDATHFLVTVETAQGVKWMTSPRR
jgi:hypothetical protein